jgi:SAM-dependent methyltransferase
MVDAAGWDARYREKHADEELVWSADPNVFVAAETAGLAPGRVLDLGGGEGRNALWLASRGWEAELVEFSGVALQRAAALADRAGIELACTRADLTDPPELEPADLVLLAYVHLPADQSTRLHRLAASLVASGGTLLIVAHARRNLVDGVGGPPDPAVLRDVDEVLVDLEVTGLSTRKAEEVTRTVDTDDGPREAIDLLVRAERPAD